jgi:hypothetical protein
MRAVAISRVLVNKGCLYSIHTVALAALIHTVALARWSSALVDFFNRFNGLEWRANGPVLKGLELRVATKRTFRQH